MDIKDYELIVNEMGQTYIELRKECLTSCANLFDTHEVTLAEKNCMGNCFKKMSYAYQHFDKMAFKSLPKLQLLEKGYFVQDY